MFIGFTIHWCWNQGATGAQGAPCCEEINLILSITNDNTQRMPCSVGLINRGVFDSALTV